MAEQELQQPLNGFEEWLDEYERGMNPRPVKYYILDMNNAYKAGLKAGLNQWVLVEDWPKDYWGESLVAFKNEVGSGVCYSGWREPDKWCYMNDNGKEKEIIGVYKAMMLPLQPFAIVTGKQPRF